jgi:hypothetical protein
LAQQVLNGIVYAIRQLYLFVSTLDEHSQFADTVEVSLETVWEELMDFLHSHITVPGVVSNVTSTLKGYVQAVPSTVWNSVPLTIVSTILSLMIIPWSLMKIDDFFQSLAERNKKELEDGPKSTTTKRAASTKKTKAS